MLQALSCEAVDHPPCSFMLFKGLQSTSGDYLEFITRQLEMGLDPYVMLPPRDPNIMTDSYNLHGLPVSFSNEVQIKEWVEDIEGELDPILVKEYHTPSGVLKAEVRKTTDWLWGDHIPFLDDYISSRSRKFLIESPEDLDRLKYLLISPTEKEIKELKESSAPIQAFANDKNLLISGGWGVGVDLLGWIMGLENMVIASYEQPQLVKDLLNIIADWNQSRMFALLDLGLDLYIKRAWYETCNFWSPNGFKEFIFPILKSDVELAHESGAKFGYIVTSKTMPLLEMYREAGVDVLIGVDPAEWDLHKTGDILGGKVCLWGGVNGHLTVERGSPEDVQNEVNEAMQTLAAEKGFILSPVDNVRELNEVSTRNVKALIEAWQSRH